MSFKGFVAFTAQVDPFFFYFLACRMARGHEEAFINQVGRKRKIPQETPTVSSLAAAMSVEELRYFSQVLVVICLEVLNEMTAPTIEGANNVVYFTRE